MNHEEAPLVRFDISKESFKSKSLNEAAGAYLLPVAADLTTENLFSLAMLVHFHTT